MITPEPSYFQQRIYGELGLTDERNHIRLLRRFENDSEQTFDYRMFDEDEAGNIIINVWTVEREVVTFVPLKYRHDKEYYDRSREFSIKRLREPIEVTDPKTGKTETRKYHIPAGAGTHPYFPSGLCDKYARGEKIATLVLTEGYLKAAKGDLCGIDVVGLSSITHIKDKESQTMYADVLKLIWKCNVENIIILFDGDCRNISMRDLESGHNLDTRPRTFFNQVNKCRELLADQKKNIWFATVKSADIPGHPKGLDDLLLAVPDRIDAVRDDLLAVSRPGVWFQKFDITLDTRKLYKWFRLDSVDAFYSHHQQHIGEHKFRFVGTEYEPVTENENVTLKVIVPGDAKNYIRVGDSYFEFVDVPNAWEKPERQLHQRLKSTIREDHNAEFFKHINKYKAFCNVPNHTNYQQVINNCFNRYFEFEHEPEPGECPTILEFLHHIFGEQFELGLDYLEILYRHPQQVLPILCLVSKENNTGKSTFVQLMKAIFTNNCTSINDFSNNFNSGWVTKLIVCCEESFIDKRQVVERIKMLSTSNKVILEFKGKEPVEIDFFAKFILCSNNEDNFIIASQNDIRYWVRKIPVIPADRLNPDFLKNMIAEIPAFLFMLSRRDFSTPRQTRMWFTAEQIRTDAFIALTEQNLPTLIKELKEVVGQFFIDYPYEKELYLTRKMIRRIFNDRWETKYIGDSIKRHLNLFPIYRQGNTLVYDGSYDKATAEAWIKRCTYLRRNYDCDRDDSFVDTGNPFRFLRDDFLPANIAFERDMQSDDEASDNEQNLPF